MRIAWVVIGIFACVSRSELTIDRVDPPAGVNTARVPVTIEGTRFHLPVESNVDDGTTTLGAIEIRIGGMSLTDVTWQSEQQLAGVVPPGLAVGPHDVEIRLGTRTASLDDGYRIISTLSTVSHVDPANAMPGTDALALDGSITIDTTALAITGLAALPAGVSFEPIPQAGGGIGLAVLRVSSLDVPTDAQIRVIGDRALVVIASGDITIAGVVDAGARRAQPGAGGSLPNTGRVGQGGAGANDMGIGGSGGVGDSGGGGGGFGTAGARGGGGGGPINDPKITIAGPPGGAEHGTPELAELAGGAAGGVGSPCMNDPGGAGGGAIQLSAFGVIRISGTIHAGGGGGGRGFICPTTGGSGGGGGSGGAIFVEATRVEIAGILAANGGGGGSGSDAPNGLSGVHGSDAAPSAMPAAGALAVGGGVGAAGGAGGWRDALPVAGGDTGYANGGGGGGAVGRIVVRAATLAISGVSSPSAVEITF